MGWRRTIQISTVSLLHYVVSTTAKSWITTFRNHTFFFLFLFFGWITMKLLHGQSIMLLIKILKNNFLLDVRVSFICIIKWHTQEYQLVQCLCILLIRPGGHQICFVLMHQICSVWFCSPKKKTQPIRTLVSNTKYIKSYGKFFHFYLDYVGLDVFWDILITTSMRSCHRSC